jgi:hypothetical protein
VAIKFHLLVETEGAVAVGSSALLGAGFSSTTHLKSLIYFSSGCFESGKALVSNA